jgi:P-type E1-E2 ATPase
VLRVFAEIDGRLAGVFTLGDAIRADARETLEQMRREGIQRLVMLTGDDESAARRLGSTLPFDRIVANATPSSKVEVLNEELEAGPTMMVGDGINDAPALAAASVGIAMGARGATASSEAADVVILVDRLDRVAEAYAIARRTRAIAMQSIVAGLALSGAGMAAAALGLLAPVAGALFQEAIDVAVIFNALRALGSGRARDPYGLRRAEMSKSGGHRLKGVL